MGCLSGHVDLGRCQPSLESCYPRICPEKSIYCEIGHICLSIALAKVKQAAWLESQTVQAVVSFTPTGRPRETVRTSVARTVGMCDKISNAAVGRRECRHQALIQVVSTLRESIINYTYCLVLARTEYIIRNLG